jgi:hypothetical protein
MLQFLTLEATAFAETPIFGTRELTSPVTALIKH